MPYPFVPAMSVISPDSPAEERTRHLFSGELGGLRMDWSPIKSYKKIEEKNSDLRAEYVLQIVTKAVELKFITPENWRTDVFAKQEDWELFLDDLSERTWWCTEREWFALSYLKAIPDAIQTFEEIADHWRDALRHE
ncbi:hypothetical protein [Cupriavidus necator]|nr:hypothetical protein [Cupriavidus necator]